MTDSTLPEPMAAALRSYIEERLGREVRLDPAPRRIARGMRTEVFAFEVAGGLTTGASAGALGPWSKPLVLRLISNDQPASAIEYEAAVYRFLRERAYPVPELLASDASGVVLGQPFAIMERAPGRPIHQLALKNPMTAFRLATAFADAHVAMHRLSVDGFPSQRAAPSVERQIESYRGWLGETEANRETFAWLEDRKSAVLPEQPAVTHNNYHPVNAIVDEQGRLQVIDWAGADVGDRHGDVADALVFMRTEPIREPGILRSLARRVGRWVFVRRYLSRYTQQYPLDVQRLRYWEALRAFAWRGTISALLPTVLEHHDIARDSYDRQIVSLGQYLRRRQSEFDAAS